MTTVVELETVETTAVVAKRRPPLAWIGTVPYFAFIALFLLWPTVTVAWQSIRNPDGSLTAKHLHNAVSGQFFRAFVTSTQLSAITAVLGGLIGVVCAYALVSLQRPRWLKGFVTTYSGVASQMGGVPLAFAFIATLGAQGFVTKFLRDSVHFNLASHGFSLFTFRGLVVVYLYFQIPLMVLVTLPAVEGLRPAWREAASNLGATRRQFWRMVGIPILLPAILGGMVLLFANAFSAYATAYALTSGQVNLVPVQIGFFVSGNVLSDKQLGNALAFVMIVVIAVAIGIYQLLQRRTARWLR